MDNKEQLISLAESTKKLAKILERTNANIRNLSSEQTKKEYSSYTNQDGRNFFIKRALRHATEELISFDDKNIEHLHLVLSLLCFSQDWDTVLSSIQEIPDTFNMTDVNVESWGHIYQNFDVNFLKQLRNAIAHSKFSYDFENKQLSINSYNGTFKVSFPLNFLCSIPWSLWNLSESYTSPEAMVNCNILNLETRNPKFYNINVRNDVFDLSSLSKYPTIQPIEHLLQDLKDEESINGVPLINKSNLFKIVINSKLNTTGVLELEDIQDIARLCGLVAQDVNKLEANDVLFKGNFFLKEFFNAQNILFDENKQHRLSYIISSIIDQRNENFFPSVQIGELLFTINSNDTKAQKFNYFNDSLLPLSIDSLQNYTERAYFNFVFNYIYERTTPNATTLDTELQSTFNKVAPNINGASSMSELIVHLRNCIVHPNRFTKNNNQYNLCDFDRRHNQTFSATLSSAELMEIADSFLESLKDKKQESISSSSVELGKE
ncbi:MAG: hypothetical protein IKC11_03745 [Clostridia bacterium]|nr:hypothetical protein [Clostridia bacterium]